MKNSIFLIMCFAIITCSSGCTGETYSYYDLTGHKTADVIAMEKNSSPYQSYRESIDIDKIAILDISYKKTRENIKVIIDGESSNSNDYSFFIYVYYANAADTFAVSNSGYVFYYDERSSLSYSSCTAIKREGSDYFVNLLIDNLSAIK